MCQSSVRLQQYVLYFLLKMQLYLKIVEAKLANDAIYHGLQIYVSFILKKGAQFQESCIMKGEGYGSLSKSSVGEWLGKIEPYSTTREESVQML